MSKRNAAIYRKAARLIDEGSCCHACTAIQVARGKNSSTEEFEKWFQPYSCPSIWWGPCVHNSNNLLSGQKHKLQRVLGLLFMAAIAESE